VTVLSPGGSGGRGPTLCGGRGGNRGLAPGLGRLADGCGHRCVCRGCSGRARGCGTGDGHQAAFWLSAILHWLEQPEKSRDTHEVLATTLMQKTQENLSQSVAQVRGNQRQDVQLYHGHFNHSKLKLLNHIIGKFSKIKHF
jgi:hypothetical protein